MSLKCHTSELTATDVVGVVWLLRIPLDYWLLKLSCFPSNALIADCKRLSLPSPVPSWLYLSRCHHTSTLRYWPCGWCLPEMCQRGSGWGSPGNGKSERGPALP